MKEQELKAAHKCSIYNQQQVLASKLCGCFYCERIFNASEVDNFLEENKGGKTAWCPYCDTDAVIGDASGFPVTKEFLSAMNKRWFH